MTATVDVLCESLRKDPGGERGELAATLANAMFRRTHDTDLSEAELAYRRELALAGLEAFEQGCSTSPRITVRPKENTTLVDVHVTDMPFLYSTITEELVRLGLQPAGISHPVVGVERDEDGTLLAIVRARESAHRESYICMDLQTVLSEEEQRRVAERINAVVLDNVSVVDDYPAMKQQMNDVAAEIEVWLNGSTESAEVAQLLQWMAQDYAVLLGYRRYDITDGVVTVAEDTGLGLLRDASDSRFAAPKPITEIPERLRTQILDPSPLHIARTSKLSTVHRPVRMLDMGVPRFDSGGELIGRHRFLVLLGQTAHVEPSSRVPLLRHRLATLIDAEDVIDNSEEDRSLRTVFDALPKHELFELTPEELRSSLVALLDVGRRGNVRLQVRPERSGHSLSVLVAVPRDRFSAQLRQRVQTYLMEELTAESVDYQLSMTERDQPLLHFTLRMPEGTAMPENLDVPTLTNGVSKLTRSFADEVTEALTAEMPADEAVAVVARWSEAWPAAYDDQTTLPMAVTDIAELEELVSGDDEVRVLLVRNGDAAENEGTGIPFSFRLYKKGEGVELSAMVPLLESLGFVVIAEHPHDFATTDDIPDIHLHDYGVRMGVGTLDLEEDGLRVAEAALAMWRGEVDADALNQLVISANLSVNQVRVLRSYRRYFRQVGTTYTEATMNEALLEHPETARGLWEHFETLFDPDIAEGERESKIESTRMTVLRELDSVDRLDHDRILRRYLATIDATLRTNYYQNKPHLSMKLRSADVPGQPKPIPFAEIFVYAPNTEGIHLRGGPVARGGLRWSDRRDDFRTEVLGLMKAQMAKNSIIVPVGSKGGFVLNSTEDGGDLREQVKEAYRTFIRGLLDLTDNIVDGAVVTPDLVVHHDGDDPYLVVAADKGTATFSDVANAISEEYGFWLGDAFASGGSAGFDHKEMGITARGAWVAIQRHFRELGTDIQTEPFTVVGVGDMSGDVFGNGMLLSPVTKLQAAFDHRDIFLDPNPDTETSFAERKRLFELPRSSWQDYNKELISAGGGVFSRNEKSIPISPEVKEALGIEADELAPPELMSAILRAKADLLYFGGIGTFIKSSEETNADVGDRSNDTVRINAADVGAKVIGEGGNLAMTQRGRIEYARSGGKSNTDAVDNAAGVHTSDREVNLKILLQLAIERGELALEDRNPLLAEVTEFVGEQVLRDQYLQTGAISHEMISVPGGLGAYERLMSSLEETGKLDRAVEWLPSSDEMRRRRHEEDTMTRPELSVLIAYSKMDVTAGLVDGDVIDQPVFDEVRRKYFPSDIGERFSTIASEHRLHREIVATFMANLVINRMGITWVQRTARELGASVSDVVGAWWIAREVVAAGELWNLVEAEDGKIGADVQDQLKSAVDWTVDSMARDYLRVGAVDDIAAAIEQDRPVMGKLHQHAIDLLASGQGTPGRRSVTSAEQWTETGVDRELAVKLASLFIVDLVPGLATTSRIVGQDVVTCFGVYDEITKTLPLTAVDQLLWSLEPHGRWERGQHRGLVDDLTRLHHQLARDVLEHANGTEGEAAKLVQEHLNQGAVDRARVLVEQAVDEAGDLNAAAVAVRALSQVSGR